MVQSTNRHWMTSHLEGPRGSQRDKADHESDYQKALSTCVCRGFPSCPAKKPTAARNQNSREGLPGNASKCPWGAFEDRPRQNVQPAATLTQTLAKRHKADGWTLGARAKVTSSPKQGSLRWETHKTCSKFRAVKFCCVQNKSRGKLKLARCAFVNIRRGGSRFLGYLRGTTNYRCRVSQCFDLGAKYDVFTRKHILP